MTTKKRLSYVSLALVMGILWSGALESNAQSFFGIPLFEGDSKQEATPDSAPYHTVTAKELPLEEWPTELSVLWEKYRKSRAAGLAKVNGLYVTKLQAIQERFVSADKLEDAIRTKREIERVKKENLALQGKGDLPALDSRTNSPNPLPADVLHAYQKQLTLKSQGVAILNSKTGTTVWEMKGNLTSEGHLGGALAAKRIAEVLLQENKAFQALNEKPEPQEMELASEGKEVEELFGTWSRTGHRLVYIINSDGSARHGSGVGKWSVKGNVLNIRWDTGYEMDIELGQTGEQIEMTGLSPGRKTSNKYWIRKAAK